MWRLLGGLTVASLLACAGGADEDKGEQGDGNGPGRDDPTDTTDDTTDDPTEVDPYTVDEDGDGLSDGEEADLGLDPSNPDTDGDGYADNVEVDGNTDGADADDHPYTGGWAIDACRDELNGEGYGQGDVVDNFALMDQFGETVSVHDFCDRAIYVVFAAFW